MTQKAHLTDLLHTMRDEQLAFAGYLTSAERDDPGTAENWSARDMLIHNVVWAGRALADLEAFEASGTWAAADYGEDDAANAAIFAEYEGTSWEEVQAMVSETYAGIDAFLARVDGDLLTAVPEGLSEPIWRDIAASYITHPMVHLWGYLHEHGHLETLSASFGEAFLRKLMALDESDEWRGMTLYNLACQYAIASENATAIATLGEALNLNPGLRDWSTQDPDLDALRGDPAYQALYE
jgi:hypothetical protein